jgi:predicted glycosyltransferase
MIITLSIIQIITLTSLSGNSLSFFNRYPMKKFANQILADSQVEKRIGLYQLGNHRARMGVMTGLPSIYLNNPEDLKLFIETQNNVYIVMRQSDWQSEFRNLPTTITATDTGWGNKPIDKEEIELLLQDGLKPHLQEYSESYVLLKAKGKS